jgi:hypothetical protein
VPSAAQTKCEATAKHGRLTTPKPTEAVKGLFRGFQSKDFATQEALKMEEDSSAQDELDAFKRNQTRSQRNKITDKHGVSTPCISGCKQKCHQGGTKATPVVSREMQGLSAANSTATQSHPTSK